MCHRAFDCHGRIVYFKEKLDANSGDCFIANDQYGCQGFYKTRHRLRGPSIINGEKRRWYVHGIEITSEIELRLSSLTQPFEEGSIDFRLKGRVFNRLFIEGFLQP